MTLRALVMLSMITYRWFNTLHGPVDKCNRLSDDHRFVVPKTTKYTN